MRDVIRVERVADPLAEAPEGASSRAAAWEGPSIDGGALAAVGRVADEVLPSIVARLAVSGLGELEVRHGDWRVRVRRSSTAAHPVDGPSAAEASSGATEANPAAASSTPAARGSTIATSPAVGYFSPRAELGVGARTGQGDVLGWVDVLGIRHEVVAPVDGLVGKWFVAPGDPVEYGQELVQLVPGGPTSARAAHDDADA
jgi:biotin carboxyl carrier protein